MNNFSLQAEGRNVVMAGDGINDSAARAEFAIVRRRRSSGQKAIAIRTDALLPDPEVVNE